MKKFSRQLLASLGCGAIACVGISPITSCSLESGEDEIIFATHTLNTNSTFVSIPFTSTLIANTTVHVDIENENTGHVLLDSKEIQVKDNKGLISLNISEMADAIYSFTFKLSFPSIASKQPIKSKYFKLYYTYTPHQDDDEVVMPWIAVRKADEYNFDFEIRFRYRPSSSVLLKLKDKSNLLSFNEWGEEAVTEINLDPEPYENYFIIKFSIYLKFCVFTSSTFLFDIDLSFVNSKNVLQNTSLNGNTVTMSHASVAEMPAIYFDIQNGVLKGIKQIVPNEALASYCILRIPEGVQSIEGMAHKKDSEYEQSIEQVIFPSTLKHVATKTFTKFKNLTCIDCSSLNDGTAPVNVFESGAFYNYKVDLQVAVISPNCNDSLFENWNNWWKGETNLQMVVRAQNVTPPELFEYTTAIGSKKGNILGLNDSDIEKYQLIRIPWKINGVYIEGIEKNALDAFSQVPHVVEQNGQKYLKHRSLLLHGMLRKMNCNFKRLGINCPIVWPKFIDSFTEDCFCESHRYSDYAEELFPSGYVSEDFNSKLIMRNNISVIPNRAFCSSYYSYMYFMGTNPKVYNVREIGEDAFSIVGDYSKTGGITKEIDSVVMLGTFTAHKWERVGKRAFAGWRCIDTINLYGDEESLPSWMLSSKNNILSGIGFSKISGKRFGTIHIKDETTDEIKQKIIDALKNCGVENVKRYEADHNDGFYIIY